MINSIKSYKRSSFLIKGNNSIKIMNFCNKEAKGILRKPDKIINKKL